MTLPGPSSPEATPPLRLGPYSLASLGTLTALLILALVLGTGTMLKVSYEDTMRQQKTTLRNLSIAFSAQTLIVAQAVDQAIAQVERAELPYSPHDPVRLDYFDQRGPAQEYLLGLYVFDLDGRLLASGMPAGAALNGRLPAAPAGQVLHSEALHIGITEVDRKTGRGIINVVRPLRDAVGKRIGSVMAQVDSQRFERIYSLVELGEGGSVTLFHRDGIMLVRGPNLPSGIGNSFARTPLFQTYLPAGERGMFESVSPIDAQMRLYGYDAVSNYPLVIISGMNKSVALASWYGRLWTAVSLLVLVCMVVLFMAWRVARDTRRQRALIAQLEASEARV